MRNIKVTVEYDGTDYHGWQRQKNTSETVQEKLEEALTIINKKTVEVQGPAGPMPEYMLQARWPIFLLMYLSLQRRFR